MEQKNYIEVEQVLGLDLDHVQQQKWLKFTNLHYFGKEEIPLSTPNEKISQEHRDVHWYVCCSRKVKIKLRLYDDGSLEVLPEPHFSKSILPIPSK
jgi:hypothetical protein